MRSKIITAVVASAIIVGFTAMNASAWGWGNRGHMTGYGMMNGGGYNNNVSQQFLDETQDLQTRLAADQVELNALMAGTNPDSKRVRALSESIATAQIELEKKYRTSGNGGGRAGGNYMMGPGMMNGGYSGYGCMW
jgi:Spy/CpxP family protein refolding chaperone